MNWENTAQGCALAATLLLAGCAGGMTADQCVGADWAAIGEADGRLGAEPARFTERMEACAEHGYAADADAYRAGREAGLRILCTPDGGFDTGRAGLEYNGVCPIDSEPAFIEQFKLGARLYALTTAHEQAVDAYDKATKTLDRHRYNLRIAENRAANPNLSTENRENARQDVEYHRREIDRINYDLPLLGAAIDRTRDALDDYRTDLRRLTR